MTWSMVKLGPGPDSVQNQDFTDSISVRALVLVIDNLVLIPTLEFHFDQFDIFIPILTFRYEHLSKMLSLYRIITDITGTTCILRVGEPGGQTLGNHESI